MDNIRLTMVYNRQISDMPGSTGTIRIVCGHCIDQDPIATLGFDVECELLDGRPWREVVAKKLGEDPRWRYRPHTNCRHTKGFV